MTPQEEALIAAELPFYMMVLSDRNQEAQRRLSEGWSVERCVYEEAKALITSLMTREQIASALATLLVHVTLEED